MEISSLIDHTLLKLEATEDDIKNFCQEAIRFKTASVCVNGKYAHLVSGLLKNTGIKTCCVVGFPLGASKSSVKAFEASECIKDGAEEIDMVISIGAAKEHDWSYIENDISVVREACTNKALLKVILECCLLTDEEIIEVCKAAKRAGADYVKTSTGFSKGGATVENVSLMRYTVGNDIGVKAAGGIRSREAVERMIRAGASRIGASSTASILGIEKIKSPCLKKQGFLF